LNLEKRKQEFIEKARRLFPDYDFSKVEYVNSQTRVVVVCPIHGDFSQRPNDLLFKHGCQLCGTANRLNKLSIKRLTTEDFINRSHKIHGDLYEYSKTCYINQGTKVIVTCKIHGDFLVLPQNHTNGSLCAKCELETRKGRFTLTTDELISRYMKKWNGLYDYSLVEYKGDKKVKIICKKHGEFDQYWYDHMSCGCRKCANEKNHFNKITFYNNRPELALKEGWLYFITFENKSTGIQFNKIGITSKENVEQRYSNSSYKNYSIKTLAKAKMSNAETAVIERYILNNYKEFICIGDEKFKGRTECFEIFIDIFNEIEEYRSLCEN
jgi:hypothetical protein